MPDSQHSPERLAAKQRALDIVVEGNQRKSIINAYKLKQRLKEYATEIDQAEKDRFYTIRTLDPIIVQPERKYEHHTAALIAPYPFEEYLHHMPKGQAKSQNLSPSLSPSSRLVDPENFPIAFKKKYDRNHPDDEYIDMPKEASKLLKNTDSTYLRAPGGRTADLKDELLWRLKLRSSS